MCVSVCVCVCVCVRVCDPYSYLGLGLIEHFFDHRKVVMQILQYHSEQYHINEVNTA